ncbi:hypothetical protein DRY87_26125, partial [Salmonella enterica subsp. enterica serovar Newport]|nr:hypothetical protein [Salmonella enterica subsp. enterica serovar Newport]
QKGSAQAEEGKACGCSAEEIACGCPGSPASPVEKMPVGVRKIRAPIVLAGPGGYSAARCGAD